LFFVVEAVEEGLEDVFSSGLAFVVGVVALFLEGWFELGGGCEVGVVHTPDSGVGLVGYAAMGR
jgi:hypothetical protein